MSLDFSSALRVDVRHCLPSAHCTVCRGRPVLVWPASTRLARSSAVRMAQTQYTKQIKKRLRERSELQAFRCFTSFHMVENIIDMLKLAQPRGDPEVFEGRSHCCRVHVCHGGIGRLGANARNAASLDMARLCGGMGCHVAQMKWVSWGSAGPEHGNQTFWALHCVAPTETSQPPDGLNPNLEPPKSQMMVTPVLLDSGW